MENNFTKDFILEKLIELKRKTNSIIFQLLKIYNCPKLFKVAILAYFSKSNLFINKNNNNNNIDIIMLLNEIFENSKPFYLQFNDLILDDDFLGPLDKQKLENKEFIRKSVGFAPLSNFILLEDLSKSNELIKSTIDNFVNENLYMNNNRLETTTSILKVIYDNSNYLNNNKLKSTFKFFDELNKFQNNFNYKINDKFLISDLSLVENLLPHVIIPNSLQECIDIFEKSIQNYNTKNKTNIDFESNKELIFKIIKISTLLNGRLESDITDCFFMHMLISSNEEEQKIVSNLFNDASSNYEYSMKYDYNDLVIGYNNLIKTIKTELVDKASKSLEIDNKVFENDNGEYYLYTYNLNNIENKILIKRNDIDFLLINNFNDELKIDYLIVNDFLKNKEKSNEVIIKFIDKNKIIISLNNFENVIAYATLIENNSNKLTNKNISNNSLNEIKKYACNLILNIDNHLNELNKYYNLSFNKLHDINCLIISDDLDFFKKQISSSIVKLNFIRNSINEIFANLKLFINENNFKKINEFTKKFLL